MRTGSERIRFRADRGDARLRLDQVLVRRLREVSRMSRTRAQGWIAAGAVSVDGRPAARSSARPREGAVVEIELPPEARRRAIPAGESIELAILHEDAYLLAVDKPPGLVAHPSYKNTSGTLLNGVLWHLGSRPDARPGLVTRLDKGTSGVVLVALSAHVHHRLQRQAAAGHISKEYLAIVQGAPRPPRGVIDLPLARDEHDRRRVVVHPRGRPSVTRYEVVARFGRLALVRCELVTGRTHQIRVHLAARGWPIAGDSTYGAGRDVGAAEGGGPPPIGRPALHAWRVRLRHPVSGDELSVTAPLPADMRRLMGSAAFTMSRL